MNNINLLIRKLILYKEKKALDKIIKLCLKKMIILILIEKLILICFQDLDIDKKKG